MWIKMGAYSWFQLLLKIISCAKDPTKSSIPSYPKNTVHK